MTIPGRWDYQQCTFFFRSPRWNILTRCEPPCRWQLSFIPLTPCENTSPDPFFLIVLLTPWDDVVCHVFNILIMYCNQYIWSFFGSFGRWILHIKIQFILKILLQASGAIHSCLLWSNRSWATHHCRWKIKVCRKLRLEIKPNKNGSTLLGHWECYRLSETFLALQNWFFFFLLWFEMLIHITY